MSLGYESLGHDELILYTIFYKQINGTYYEQYFFKAWLYLFFHILLMMQINRMDCAKKKGHV